MNKNKTGHHNIYNIYMQKSVRLKENKAQTKRYETIKQSEQTKIAFSLFCVAYLLLGMKPTFASRLPQ